MLKIAGSYKLDEQFQRLDGVTVIHSMSNNVGRHFIMMLILILILVGCQINLCEDQFRDRELFNFFYYDNAFPHLF